MIGRTRVRGVETLSLDSPATRNALSHALVAELTDALKQCDKDHDVRAVVLTHTGNTFSAGADLKDPPAPKAVTGLLQRILKLRKPVVARVAGHVRAGGLGVLGACDIAVASEASTFAFTEVRIGVAPAVISLPLLPRVDPRALTRYCLTGETFGAAEAARIGLVSHSAGDTDLDEALAPVLDGLRRASPRALARTKELLTAKVLEAFVEDVGAMTGLSASLFANPDAREGMTAFLERRDPSWVL
ncbi:enoyl-CoA hydratase family protein [Streptomyces sp. NBC_01485]|uniref:enoyl-CoA hydratase family protein n=1 Tax=Streptomyces sp. NBC_01485 TaxID=2903884 RepID=UPI002E2FD726|nr:enoyl-CoA hydratase family protein [Streptomyces sp. NBC_01485]